MPKTAVNQTYETKEACKFTCLYCGKENKVEISSYARQASGDYFDRCKQFWQDCDKQNDVRKPLVYGLNVNPKYVSEFTCHFCKKDQPYSRSKNSVQMRRMLLFISGAAMAIWLVSGALLAMNIIKYNISGVPNHALSFQIVFVILSLVTGIVSYLVVNKQDKKDLIQQYKAFSQHPYAPEKLPRFTNYEHVKESLFKDME